ncbi:MAG TPA: hypothetical protein VG942_15475, partial [Hyphomonadaceae bacterium]|nr:hypothetical protein [Hyphomonadaceae bacterium]
MKPMKIIGASLALALFGATACVMSGPGSAPAAPAAAPNPPNVLDSYIAKPDPSFAWKVDHTFSAPGYHGVVIDLTSQT